MDWFRWWHGTVTDPKFLWVSRRCSMPLAEVIAVWACLLECASTATQGNADATRGNVASFDCNDYDVLLGLKDGEVEKILTAMRDKNLIVDDRIAGWDGRQPKREDSGNPNTGALSSTERSRNYREKKKLEETQCNAEQRNATQSNDRREEIRGEKKEPIEASGITKSVAARGTRLPKDWLPNDEEILFCKQERPDLNWRDVANQFRDYWVAKAGKDGSKTDWPATWRNWVRRQQASRSPALKSYGDKQAETFAAFTGRSGSNEHRDDGRTIDV